MDRAYASRVGAGAVRCCGRPSQRLERTVPTRKTIRTLARAAASGGLLTIPLPAVATTSIPLPEPGVLGLLGAAAVAGLVVWARTKGK